MAIPQIYFLTSTAASTVSTANTLTATQPSPETSKTSKIGRSTGWGVLWAQGNTGSWAAGGSEPAFGDVHGFILDDTTLEGTTWPASSHFAASYKLSTSSSSTGVIHIRIGKRSSTGVYTEICNIADISRTFTGTATSIVGVTGTSGSSVTFNTGDKLYVQIEYDITSGTSSNTATAALFENFGNPESIQVPGVGTKTQTATARIQATPTDNQSAIARIQILTSVITHADARILGTATLVQTAVARIRNTAVTATQLAHAAIQNTASATQSGKARIAKSFTSAQTSLARIQNTATNTQPAISRIQATGTITQDSVARVQNTVTATQPAIAHIASGATSTTQTATARIQTTLTDTQPSIARIQNTLSTTQPATAHIFTTGTIKSKDQLATARIINTQTKTQSATARIGLNAAEAVTNMFDTPKPTMNNFELATSTNAFDKSNPDSNFQIDPQIAGFDTPNPS